MSFRVANISSLSNGGAGIAAFRLHQAFLKTNEIESIFIQKNENENFVLEKNMVVCYPTRLSLYERLKRKLRLDLDNTYWKLLKNNLPDNNIEALSTPVSNYRVEKVSEVQSADIIHLHSVNKFLNYSTFFPNIKQPIVWTLHDMNPFMGIFHYESDFSRNIKKLGRLDQRVIKDKIIALRKAKNIHIVCLSEWMREKSEASSILGIYPHYLIANGINFSNYQYLDREKSKQQMCVANGLKTILFIASDINIKRKGFDLLLEAIRNIRHTNFNLISVGGDKIDLDASINHLHFKKIDNIERLNIIYSAADLTIIPSREDNLPNVMLESFANGTPILCFKEGGGMAEHIVNGQNGILVPTMTVGNFSNNLSSFLESKYQFNNDAIRSYAKESFADDVQAQKYIQLYKNILSRS